jgi:undecaprenyl-diphosphatase
MAAAAAEKPLPRRSRIRAALRTVADRLGPRLGLGLLAAAVVLVLLSILAGEVREGETQRFDDEVRATVHAAASPHATTALFLVTQLGSPLFLLPMTVICSLLFLRARRIRAAILLPVTMAGVTVLNWILKAVFQRGRPAPFFVDLVAPTSYSFPSGHSMASFCFYGALAVLVAVRLRSPMLRACVWTSATLVIGAIGFSRIYLGVHYASDVVAGYATGFVWVLAVASADRVFPRAHRRR